MKQYLDLVKHVLETGTRKENRTGVDTISTFNYNYEIDLKDGFPLLTTKSVSWKNIVVEMLWFLSGQTDISILKRHGCKFWDAWADPETGKVPSAYGNFWRQFPTHYEEHTKVLGDLSTISDPEPDMILKTYLHAGFNDQIAWVLAELKRNPMSRRMVVSAWAPGNAQTSKLPPCHCLFMFNVQNEELFEKVFSVHGIDNSELGYVESDNANDALVKAHVKYPGHPDLFVSSTQSDFELSIAKSVRWNTKEDGIQLHGPLVPSRVKQRLCLHLTQRSCDVALGVPYNIASYALLLSLFSHFTGIEPGIFGHTLVDAHIYTAKPDGSKAEFDHIPGLKEQLTREPKALPKLIIDPSIKDLSDIERLMGPEVSTEEVMKHFVLEGYEPYPAINFKVAV